MQHFRVLLSPRAEHTFWLTNVYKQPVCWGHVFMLIYRDLDGRQCCVLYSFGVGDWRWCLLAQSCFPDTLMRCVQSCYTENTIFHGGTPLCLVKSPFKVVLPTIYCQVVGARVLKTNDSALRCISIIEFVEMCWLIAIFPVINHNGQSLNWNLIQGHGVHSGGCLTCGSLETNAHAIHCSNCIPPTSWPQHLSSAKNSSTVSPGWICCDKLLKSINWICLCSDEGVFDLLCITPVS